MSSQVISTSGKRVDAIIARADVAELHAARKTVDRLRGVNDGSRANTISGTFQALHDAVEKDELRRIIVAALNADAQNAYTILLRTVASVSLDAARSANTCDPIVEVLNQWCTALELGPWAVLRWHFRENRMACVYPSSLPAYAAQSLSWSHEFAADCFFPRRAKGTPDWIRIFKSPEQARHHHASDATERVISSDCACCLGLGSRELAEYASFVRATFSFGDVRYATVMAMKKSLQYDLKDLQPSFRYVNGLLYPADSLKFIRPKFLTTPIAGVGPVVRDIVRIIGESRNERSRQFEDLMRRTLEIQDLTHSLVRLQLHRLRVDQTASRYSHVSPVRDDGREPNSSDAASTEDPTMTPDNLMAIAESMGRSLAVADFREIQKRQGAIAGPHSNEAIPIVSMCAAVLAPLNLDRKTTSKEALDELDRFGCSAAYHRPADRGDALRSAELLLNAYHNLQVLYLQSKMDQVARSAWVELRTLVEHIPSDGAAEALMSMICEQVRRCADADLCYFLARDYPTRHLRSCGMAIDPATVPAVIKREYEAKSHLGNAQFASAILRFRLLPRKHGRTMWIIENGKRRVDSVGHEQAFGQETYDQLQRCFRDCLGWPFGSDLSVLPEGVLWLRWIDVVPGATKVDRHRKLEEFAIRIIKGCRPLFEAAASIYLLLRNSDVQARANDGVDEYFDY